MRGGGGGLQGGDAPSLTALASRGVQRKGGGGGGSHWPLSETGRINRTGNKSVRLQVDSQPGVGIRVHGKVDTTLTVAIRVSTSCPVVI